MWLCIFSCKPFEETFENAQWSKMLLCILTSRRFEETFENTHWRKVKQMQPMWFCIFSGRWFEETFDKAHWRKIKQMQPMWLCWTARSMERSIFFFLKSHILAPGAQNSPIFFPSWSFPIIFTCNNWFWSHLGPLHGRNWQNVSKKCFSGCPRFWVPPK